MNTVNVRFRSDAFPLPYRFRIRLIRYSNPHNSVFESASVPLPKPKKIWNRIRYRDYPSESDPVSPLKNSLMMHYSID